ncbi:hypothetical protein BBK36DRAFT_1122372 [Trichoderma citrinoviride]|uniref:Uncharacterized protein n=1 Tax=Trichoderma citrinoviride TaxID=58853 RepID=A0A2T4B6Y4_9HYPO|nr:hypothetical protein BBK36DRAFT_1122372 [Trichoderma citrinoviride]PTB65085.1 hypothetical protein BBK36DRAFT_1122372 [Trichoderma citrinoviride]
MRVQRTFTVVPAPGPAERTPVDNRPMTSKQVRKAYREANRVPRVSKAELRRQERAEQERIRKELEKEKAASKAKALREKKRAKEQAEREEKKKKGLPLVNVRPSQDTIARFVRGNGSGSKRDCQGRDTSAAPVLPTVEESEEEDDLPSPKRFCETKHELKGIIEEPEQDEAGTVPERGESETPAAPEEPLTELDTVPHNEPVAEEDFLEGFEVMSDDEISKLSFNAVVAKGKVKDQEDPPPIGPDATPSEGESVLDETTARQPDPPNSIKNPEAMALPDFDLISDDEDDLELEMLALDVVLTPQQQLPKEAMEKPLPPKPQNYVPTKSSYETDLGLAAGLEEPSPTKHQASLMPPPPLPAAPQRPRSQASPVAMKPQAPPLSTQQILYNMDDFFPTSSQQAAELEGEETTFISQHTTSGSMPAPQAASPIVKKNSPLPLDAASSSPGTPKPFFTASGTNERIAVALLHSRRTAEREEEERRRTAELEALAFEEAKRRAAERRAEERQAESQAESRPITTAESTKARVYEQPQIPRQGRPVAATSPQFPTGKAFIPNANRAASRVVTQRRPLAESRANAALPGKLPPAAEVKNRAPYQGAVSRQQPSRPTHANTPLPPKAQNIPSFPKDHDMPIKTSNKENKAAPEVDEFKDLMASQESEFGGSWMDELATELSL